MSFEKFLQEIDNISINLLARNPTPKSPPHDMRGLLQAPKMLRKASFHLMG